MAVFFTEIILPILEGRKNIPWYQRHSLLKALNKLFGAPDGGQMLVEIYVNYDCDVEATAKENLWERLMNALAKVTSQHVDVNAPVSPFVYCFVNSGNGTPALTTNNLVMLSKEQVKDLFAVTGDAKELRKQGVALMRNGVLRSLMDWCTEKADPRKSEEKRSGHDRDGSVGEDDSSSIKDDPTAIGNLKLRKQQLIEGIKKFNLKPKKVNFCFNSRAYNIY